MSSTPRPPAPRPPRMTGPPPPPRPRITIDTAQPAPPARARLADPASQPGAPRRKSPAHGARAAALGASVLTTVGLAGLFAFEAKPSAPELAAGQTMSGQLGSSTASAGAATPTTIATSATAASPTTVTAPATSAVSATSPTTARPTAAVTAATAARSATTVARAGSTLTDGTYTGDVSSNRWGDVQVQITVAGGRLTAVDILQSPDGERRSIAINARSLPTLVARTLTAQSAKVNSVSGATYTSNSYKESLQSAIDQALS